MQKKNRYSVVYTNDFWQFRGGYATLGLDVIPTSTKAEARKIIKDVLDNKGHHVLVIDLKTGKAVSV